MRDYINAQNKYYINYRFLKGGYLYTLPLLKDKMEYKHMLDYYGKDKIRITLSEERFNYFNRWNPEFIKEYVKYNGKFKLVNPYINSGSEYLFLDKHKKVKGEISFFCVNIYELREKEG